MSLHIDRGTAALSNCSYLTSVKIHHSTEVGSKLVWHALEIIWSKDFCFLPPHLNTWLIERSSLSNRLNLSVKLAISRRWIYHVAWPSMEWMLNTGGQFSTLSDRYKQLVKLHGNKDINAVDRNTVDIFQNWNINVIWLSLTRFKALPCYTMKLTMICCAQADLCGSIIDRGIGIGGVDSVVEKNFLHICPGTSGN